MNTNSVISFTEEQKKTIKGKLIHKNVLKLLKGSKTKQYGLQSETIAKVQQVYSNKTSCIEYNVNVRTFYRSSNMFGRAERAFFAVVQVIRESVTGLS